MCISGYFYIILKSIFYKTAFSHDNISNITVHASARALFYRAAYYYDFRTNIVLKVINNINKTIEMIYAQVGAFVSTTRLARIVTGAQKDTTVTLCRAPRSTVNCVRAPTREVAF